MNLSCTTKRFLISTFIAFCWINVNAQTDLQGIVRDQENSPLPGVNIFLHSDPLQGTTSNEDGQFSITIQKELPLTLVFSMIGYQKQTININENELLRVVMVESVSQMEEIVIKAEKMAADELQHISIERMGIYKNPAAKADPLLAVNAHPSATNLDESANVTLRGSLPAETAIFLDGVPIYDAIRYEQVNGVGTFSIFNTAIIDDLKVFPGISPIEYGNHTGGLVAINTNSTVPEINNSEVILSLANVGFTHRRKLRKGGLMLFSNYQPSDLFLKLNEESLQSLEDFHSWDAGVHYGTRINERWQVKAFNYTNLEGYRFNEPFGPEFKQEKQRNLSILNLARHGEAHSLHWNQGLSLSQQRLNFEGNEINIDRRSYFSSINMLTNRNNNDMKMGVNLDYRDQKYIQNMQSFDSKILDVQFFVFRQFRFGNGWNLGAGTSLNTAGNFGSNLIVNKKINQHHNFRLSYSGNQKEYLPDQYFNQKYHVNANQYSLEYNMQYEQMRQDVALYFNQKNYNGERTDLLGFEWFFQQNIQKISYQIGYSLLQYTNPYEQDALALVLTDLDYFVRGGLSLELPFQFTWNLNSIYRQGGMFNNQDNQSERLPDYFIIDLNLSKMMLLGDFPLIAFASCNNVLDRQNIRGYHYLPNGVSIPQEFSRRTFYLGVNLLLN